MTKQQEVRWAKINAHREGGKSFCTCGHRGDGPNSQHEDRTEFAPGHGACREAGCPCVKFRWDRWVAV